MNSSVARRKLHRKGNCTEKYFRELRDQNGEHLVNICESNILEKTKNRTLLLGA